MQQDAEDFAREFMMERALETAEMQQIQKDAEDEAIK